MRGDVARGIGNRQKKVVAPKRVWVKPISPREREGVRGRQKPGARSRELPKASPSTTPKAEET